MVLPHFDQLENWVPGVTQWALDAVPDGTHLLGIDEDTAIVGGPRRWRVMGRQRAWDLRRNGEHRGYLAGEELDLDAEQLSARPA
jgi:cyanophycinase